MTIGLRVDRALRLGPVQACGGGQGDQRPDQLPRELRREVEGRHGETDRVRVVAASGCADASENTLVGAARRSEQAAKGVSRSLSVEAGGRIGTSGRPRNPCKGFVVEVGGVEGGVEGAQTYESSVQPPTGLVRAEAVALTQIRGNVAVPCTPPRPVDREDQQVQRGRVGAKRRGPDGLAKVTVGAGGGAAAYGVVAADLLLQVQQWIVNELGSRGTQPGRFSFRGRAAESAGKHGRVLVGGLWGGQVLTNQGQFPDRLPCSRHGKWTAQAGETLHQQVFDGGLTFGAPTRPHGRVTGRAGVPGPVQGTTRGSTHRGCGKGIERGERDGVIRVGQVSEGEHGTS